MRITKQQHEKLKIDSKGRDKILQEVDYESHKYDARFRHIAIGGIRWLDVEGEFCVKTDYTISEIENITK